VLDFAHTTLKRLKSEKKIAPRDGSMLVYLSLVSDLGRYKALMMGVKVFQPEALAYACLPVRLKLDT